MADNGSKEVQEYGGYAPSMGRRIRQPSFEKDILTPSPVVMEAIAQSYFPDEVSLNNACQYIAWLELFDLKDEIRAALYKINGNRAIQARSLRYAVQAHGGLYWPDDMGKDEKKFLSKQFKDKGMDELPEGKKLE